MYLVCSFLFHFCVDDDDDRDDDVDDDDLHVK